MTAETTVQYDSATQTLICEGDWNLANLPQLQQSLQKVNWPSQGELIIDGKAITKMDSAGAWLIGQQQVALQKLGLSVQIKNFSEEHQHLFSLVEERVREEKPLTVPVPPGLFERVGMMVQSQLAEFLLYLSFIGKLATEFLRISASPKHFRISSLSSVIFKNGYQALPIIALLSFMIGVVLTYQMGLQLKNYGANIFIVDLLGIATLREFAPLITAIMVAGRTGSAFTAQLGMMKLNQEIDALDTLGVTPAELLLLPRIMGLIIALPLLTMWANIFGVFGGMVMANNMLSISWYDFLHRFPTVVPLRTLLIGLGKTPVFAMIISSIGCFQGMRVEGGADSVGQNTTRSVVLSIFFIIVADALFSIIFSKLKL